MNKKKKSIRMETQKIIDFNFIDFIFISFYKLINGLIKYVNKF